MSGGPAEDAAPRDAGALLDSILGEGERVLWAGDVARVPSALWRDLWGTHAGLDRVRFALAAVCAVGVAGYTAFRIRVLGEPFEIGYGSRHEIVCIAYAVFVVFYVAAHLLRVLSRRYVVTSRRVLVIDRPRGAGPAAVREQSGLQDVEVSFEPWGVWVGLRLGIVHPTDREGLMRALVEAGATQIG